MRIILLILVALSSCSKKHEIPVDDSGIRRIPVSGPLEAEKVVSQARLSCQNPEDCSLAVGMMLAKTKTEVITCTAFLVDHDLVVTNSHCIPYEFKNGKSCNAFIEILLPIHTKGKIKHNCKEIINFSERPNALSPDLAVLRLETSSIQSPIGFSFNGFSEPLIALKVNPLKGASGILVRENCAPAISSYRFPPFEAFDSPVGLLGDCQSLPGNSGSPLLNAQKQVVGVLQANVPVSQQQKKAWSPYLAKSEDFAPLALATNISCLSSLPWQWNERCQPVDEESIQRTRISDYQPNRPPSLASFFQWKETILKEKSLERLLQWEPLCVEERYLTQFPQPQSIDLALPVYREHLEFNRYLQMRLVTENSKEPQKTVNIRLGDGKFPVCR